MCRLCSTPSHLAVPAPHLSFSPTHHLLIENHRSLIQICITSSLESTTRFIRSASPVTPRLTSSFTCQLISIIITTLVIHHSFTLSLQAQNYTFSTNPSHLRLLLPTGLPSWQRDWTGPIMLIVLFLVSHFNFFCSVWWTKLATRQLFTAR